MSYYTEVYQIQSKKMSYELLINFSNEHPIELIKNSQYEDVFIRLSHISDSLGVVATKLIDYENVIKNKIEINNIEFNMFKRFY